MIGKDRHNNIRTVGYCHKYTSTKSTPYQLTLGRLFQSCLLHLMRMSLGSSALSSGGSGPFGRQGDPETESDATSSDKRERET